MGRDDLDFTEGELRMMRMMSSGGPSPSALPSTMKAMEDIIMNGMQRLAQAERDNMDLHRALGEAVRVLRAVQRALTSEQTYAPDGSALWALPIVTEDLVRNTAEMAGNVLDRTSRPNEVPSGNARSEGQATPIRRGPSHEEDDMRRTT
jgi:hypothetical protein